MRRLMVGFGIRRRRMAREEGETELERSMHCVDALSCSF